jgi:hypothetical protein
MFQGGLGGASGGENTGTSITLDRYAVSDPNGVGLTILLSLISSDTLCILLYVVAASGPGAVRVILYPYSVVYEAHLSPSSL